MSLVDSHKVYCIPLKDDMDLFDYNVQERVNDFVAAAVAQVKLFFLKVYTLLQSSSTMITVDTIPHR